MIKRFGVLLLKAEKQEHSGLVFVENWNVYVYMEGLVKKILAKDECFQEMYIIEHTDEITISDIGTWFMVSKTLDIRNPIYFISRLEKINGGDGRYADTYCFENGYTTNILFCCDKIIATTNISLNLPSIPISYLKQFAKEKPRLNQSVLLEMEYDRSHQQRSDASILKKSKVRQSESGDVLVVEMSKRINMEYKIDKKDALPVLQFVEEELFRNFLRQYHLTHVWEKFLKSAPVFTSPEIIADMDKDLQSQWCLARKAVPDIWKNKYLIIKR